MAYNSRHLSVLAYADGFTLWHYRSTEDTCADIHSSAYFNGASGMFRPGDMIIYNGKDGNGFGFCSQPDNSLEELHK